MKITAILVLTLALTSCLKLEQNAFVEMTRDDPFGQAVLSLTQLTLQTTQPTGQLQAIRDLLGEIQGELDAIQESAEANFNAGEATCSIAIDQLTSELQGLKATQLDTQQEKDELVEERESKTQELADKRSNLQQDEADLLAYQNQLTQEQQVFEEQSNNFQEAIDACDEAVRLLGTILVQQNSVSFAQTGSVFVQLSQKFQNVKQILTRLEEKAAPNAFIQPIIDVLVELGSNTKINYEQVQEIVALITTLRDRLLAGLGSRQTAHATNTENLNQLVLDLQQQVAEHTQQVQNFDQRLGGIQDGMSQKDRILATANEMVVLKETLLSITKNDCEQSKEGYVTSTTQRQHSSELVQKLIDYFEEQIVSSVQAVDEP